MSHVFVSYSRRDSQTVDQIVSRLEAEQFTVWIDREDIHGGELWRESIVEAVDNAYAFVLMLSPSSVTSDNVRKEVDLAEGAGKSLLPMLLAQAQLPARLRYQLAGIQWIEYYRDPHKKFDELVIALRVLDKKYGTTAPPVTRQVEFVFRGVDLLRLSQEERQQLQERLLDVIANSTNTPRTNLNVVTMTVGSVHIFVDMPAETAYQVKTAALNKDRRLVRAGIDALRLSGDRDFIPLITKSKAPPKSGKKGGGSRWLMGGFALLIVLLLAGMSAYVAFSWFVPEILAPTTPASTFTPTVTSTPTATPTGTATPTHTPTPTSTFTATPSDTPTPTPTDTPTPPPTASRSERIPITTLPSNADTTPPTIHSVEASSSRVDAPAACEDPTTVTVTALVTDSESAVQRVDLFYSYNGVNQRPLPMLPTGTAFGAAYQATINVAAGYRGTEDGVLGYTVQAVDETGNRASQPNWPVFIHYCPGVVQPN